MPRSFQVTTKEGRKFKVSIPDDAASSGSAPTQETGRDPVAVADDLISRQYQSPYQQRMAGVEQDIAQRKSVIPEFARNAATALQDPMQMLSPNIPQQLKNMLLGAQAMGAGFEAAESIPANALLAAEQNKPILPAMKAGLYGERPGQFGDVYRTSDNPIISNPAVSSALGVATTMLPGATKLAAKPVAAVTEAAYQVPKSISKFMGRWVNSYFNQIERFANTKIPQINSGLQNFKYSLNKTYGENIQKVVQKVKDVSGKEVLDADRIIARGRNFLRQYEFMTPTGEVVVDNIKALKKDSVEKQALDMVEELVGIERLPTLYGAEGQPVSGGVREFAKKITPEAIVDKIQDLTSMINKRVVEGKAQPTNKDRMLMDLREIFLDELEPYAGKQMRSLRQQYAIERQKYNRAFDLFQPLQEELAVDKGFNLMKNLHEKIDIQRNQNFLRSVEEMSKVRFVDKGSELAGFAADTQAAGGFLGIGNAGAFGRVAGKVTQDAVRTALPPEVQAIILKQLLPKSQESEQ